MLSTKINMSVLTINAIVTLPKWSRQCVMCKKQVETSDIPSWEMPHL